MKHVREEDKEEERRYSNCDYSCVYPVIKHSLSQTPVCLSI